MGGLTGGVVELDLHGMTQIQAKAAVDAALRRAGGSVYRLRVVHGYRGGTQLRDMLCREYAEHPKVKRLERGLNPGATDLVLREY